MSISWRTTRRSSYPNTKARARRRRILLLRTHSKLIDVAHACWDSDPIGDCGHSRQSRGYRARWNQRGRSSQALAPDRMDPALSIMSDVRAYFQVAYKRMADNVLAAIDSELVRGVGRELLPTLYRGLGINGPEGVTHLSGVGAGEPERRREAGGAAKKAGAPRDYEP
ncbi:hypothetical protein B0H13DRAFT_866691 [Mycena leptocephala]|nr:hypothetical protein B0H13DRAFT_866691 [Mycena leptocephala]